MDKFCKLMLSLIFGLLLHYVTAEGSPEEKAPRTPRLKSFIASKVRLYNYMVMRMPYTVPDNLFRGGDVSNSFVVPINKTELRLSADWTRLPEIGLDTGSSIEIKFEEFFDYELDGTYTLQGLENAAPVVGNGNFMIKSNLTVLTFYYFYDVDATNHIVLNAAYTYYSNYVPYSYLFQGTNSSDEAYHKGIATAITEFSLRNLWAVYNQKMLMDYLGCLFEKVSLDEIEAGVSLDPYECDPGMGGTLPTEPVTTETSPATTPTATTSTPTTVTTTRTNVTSTLTTVTPSQAPTTTRPTTTTPQPDISFNCSGKPDGYYQHPSNCSRFIGCLNGQVREYSCPTFLVFHPSRLTCVHPDEYICPSPTITCTGRPDGYYASPRNCIEFFGCLNQILVKTLYCLTDYFFDERRQTCVPQSERDCMQRFEIFEQVHQPFHGLH